jgi:DNA primase
LLKKFKPNSLVDSGLCILKNNYQNVSVIKSTMVYDRFRSRVMFPIFNTSNQVIGYTARIFGDNLKTIKDIKQTGKYINSPQTIIYDKSKNLFGIKQAKTAILQKDSVILTEGPTDMITCFQEGIENVVASLGTALTLDQLKLLKRYTSNIILAVDSDEAGQKAIERSIEIALKEGFNLKIITLPQGKDIAEFVLNNKGKLKEIIDSAKSVMHFYLKRANNMYDKTTLKGKKDILNYFLGKLKNISNIIDRAYWVEKTANFLKIESSLVEELLSQIKQPESQIEENDLIEKNISRHEMLSENVLIQFLLFKIPKEKIIENKKYFHEKYQFTIDLIKNDLIDDAIKQKDLKEKGFDLTKEEYIRLSGIDLKTGQEDPGRNLFDHSLQQLQKEYIKNQINHLQKEIKIAEKNQNQGKLEELLKEFQFLTNKLKK